MISVTTALWMLTAAVTFDEYAAKTCPLSPEKPDAQQQQAKCWRQQTAREFEAAFSRLKREPTARKQWTKLQSDDAKWVTNTCALVDQLTRTNLDSQTMKPGAHVPLAAWSCEANANQARAFLGASLASGQLAPFWRHVDSRTKAGDESLAAWQQIRERVRTSAPDPTQGELKTKEWLKLAKQVNELDAKITAQAKATCEAMPKGQGGGTDCAPKLRMWFYSRVMPAKAE